MGKIKRKYYFKNCGKTNIDVPTPKMFSFPQKSKKVLCVDHFPKNLFGKKKLKKSSYCVIQKILDDNDIQIPNFNIHKSKTIYISKKCIFKHCLTNNLKQISMYKFPNKNDPNFKLWVSQCGLTIENVPDNSYICQKHFDSYSTNKRKLKKNYIPNCNLTESMQIKPGSFKNDLSTYDFDSNDENEVEINFISAGTEN